jgi:hypothetical protein
MTVRNAGFYSLASLFPVDEVPLILNHLCRAVSFDILVPILQLVRYFSAFLSAFFF